jgi:ParB/RepB/Spo0J family partition protein
MAKFKKNPFDIPDFTKEKNDYVIREINIGVIDEDPINDEIYDEDNEALQELTNDINSVGLSTPLTVRRNQLLSDRYTLIAGHRRLKALKSLGHKTVPCLVKSIESDKDRLKADVMHLTSNIMTRDRTVLERAREAKLLKERIMALKEIEPDAYKGKTDEIVAKMMKVSSSYVRQLVRVENADDDIKELLADEVIGIADALKLQTMDSVQKKEVAEKIRSASSDSEMREITKAELMKKKEPVVQKRSATIKEEGIDNIIEKDLEKLEKLVMNLVENIDESEINYKEEINNIIDKLKIKM